MLRSSRRVLDKRQTRAEGRSSATSRSSRRVQAPFPRITYDEAVKILHAKGLPFEWGGDFGGTDETVLSEQFDRPVVRAPLPVGGQGVLHEARPASGPDVALCVDVLAPEGYGEIIGGGQRLADYDLLRAAHQGAQPAAGSLRVVPRPAPLRHRCRTAASAWASSASSPGSAASSTCARRFRTRGCCTGCTRRLQATDCRLQAASA